MTARKKPLTIHDFPEVDLGDNHVIHAKNLFVKHNTDNFYRVYILHIRKYCYDENKNPRFILIDDANIGTFLNKRYTINIARTIGTKTPNIYFYPIISVNSINIPLPQILFGELPKDKIFIYNNSTLDVRKKSLSIGSHSDKAAEVHSNLVRVDLSENMGVRKIYDNGSYKMSAKISYNKKIYTKSFSINYHNGEENARKLAIEWRNAK